MLTKAYNFMKFQGFGSLLSNDKALLGKVLIIVIQQLVIWKDEIKVKVHSTL